MNDVKNLLQVRNYNFSQSFNEQDNFTISDNNYGIKDIIDSTITVLISSYVLLPTKSDYKLLIKGYRILSITYVSNDPCGKVYTKKFSKQILDCLSLNYLIEIKNLTPEIIYTELSKSSENELNLNLIYSLSIQSTVTYYAGCNFKEWKKIISCDSYSIKGDNCNCNKWYDPFSMTTSNQTSDIFPSQCTSKTIRPRQNRYR